MQTIEPGRTYDIDYTNYRGERGRKRIRVLRVDFGRNEYHPTPGILVVAVDLERDVERTYAASGLHDIAEAPSEASAEGGAVA